MPSAISDRSLIEQIAGAAQRAAEARAARTAQETRWRALLSEAFDQGVPNSVIAEAMGLQPTQVQQYRKKYATARAVA